MLIPILTLATPPSEIESICQVEFINRFIPSFRLVPGNEIPVITNESFNKVFSIPWGFPSRKNENERTPWLRSEGIIKKAGIRVLVRLHRCLVFTNCFYSGKGENLYLFYHPKEKVMALAGLWKTVRTGENLIESHFAIITRDAPQRLNKYSNRVPVILSRSSIRKFLNIKLPLMDITGIINSIHYPELNGYNADPSILHKPEWVRNDLLPAGDRLFAEEKFPGKAILHNRYYFS
jgi:putative SOS response-associated peptidase YedK